MLLLTEGAELRVLLIEIVDSLGSSGLGGFCGGRDFLHLKTTKHIMGPVKMIQLPSELEFCIFVGDLTKAGMVHQK